MPGSCASCAPPEALGDGVGPGGTWTRIEIAAAITRAARGRLGSAAPLLDAVLAALSDDGPVSVVCAAQDDVEAIAFRLASEHGLRAMAAWHVACALVIIPQLAEDGEERAFATRNAEQGAVARSEGLLTI